MARLNFTEIEPASGKSNDLDQFEKFSKIFLESVVGGKIIKGPSRGADGGIDLCLETQENCNIVKKLVSCKHYAHSKESVGVNDEVDIRDRLEGFDCKVFVGLYSTIASTGLEQKLERLKREKNIDFELYNSEDIETLLLSGLPGFRVAKRFFPKSIQNVWPQVISLEKYFSPSDAVCVDGLNWFVPSAFTEKDIIVYANTPENAVRLANEIVTKEIHQPMFLAAWKDAVRYFSDYFIIPQSGIEGAKTIHELPPHWDAAPRISELSPNKRWSLLAIWSLVNPQKVRELLRELGRDPSQQELDLMSFEWLASSTGTDRRDILTRLFAYHSL